MELENDRVIPFLDVNVIREGGRLKLRVRRKKIHTDRYLHFNSNHHPQTRAEPIVPKKLPIILFQISTPFSLLFQHIIPVVIHVRDNYILLEAKFLATGLAK